MSRAFVFPGQGSQAVGMGRGLAEAFAEARLVFEEVDDALSQKLSALMFDGPEGDLTLTENAQPALMAVGMAAVRVLEGQGGAPLSDKAAFFAGHSLGEYTALAAAGALPLADTARLLKRRGQAMQSAVPVGKGAMIALLGPDAEVAEAVARDAAGSDVCEMANDNAPGQAVLAGSAEAIDRATALAKERGAKKVVPLSVSAPFHCALMRPAADTMAEALAGQTIAPPRRPVVANVTAQGESDPETIRRLLVEQVTATVRWRESVLWMRDQGVSEVVELGAGKVLTTMLKRIDRDMKGEAAGEPAEIEALLRAL
ncbi:ACP S-malonyltransferase [Marinibaculum pumilum]|uniref:Malonyl CoA-acyl carrier protein transacylase n=1 Tax=Marinibaculum pumilum TaxID=1766165 RepID=A0ABV7KTP5_9PROT